MAIKARATITITAYRDTSSITRYYKLQASTLATPSKPTTNPPSGWSDAEPAYSSGSTNTLYFCDLSVFSDGTWAYSTVSKSSSYEAAKAAQNTATTARTEAANAAKVATNYIEATTDGFVVGNVNAGTLKSNVLIDSDSVDIRNGTEVLASYGEGMTLYDDEIETFSIQKATFLQNIITNGRFYSRKSPVINDGNNDKIYIYFQSGTYSYSSGIHKVYDSTKTITLVSGSQYIIHVRIKGTTMIGNPDKYLMFTATSSGRLNTFYWDTSAPTRVKVNGTEIACSCLDRDAVIEITAIGSLWINNLSDVSGTSKGIPPLAIGSKTGERLEIDSNEVMAKSDDTTPAPLYLNMEGGMVSINNNTDRAMKFQNGIVYGKNSSQYSGNWVNVLDCITNSGNVSLGYGPYANSQGATNIYGNVVNLISKSGVKMDGREYGVNKSLWSGALYMKADHTVTLSEAVSAQPHGIVLIFSYYTDSAAQNNRFSSFFVPKQYVVLHSGMGMNFSALDVSYHFRKYLYITDTTVKGHDDNSKASITVGGVTMSPNKYVLRYVIGV